MFIKVGPKLYNLDRIVEIVATKDVVEFWEGSDSDQLQGKIEQAVYPKDHADLARWINAGMPQGQAGRGYWMLDIDKWAEANPE